MRRCVPCAPIPYHHCEQANRYRDTLLDGLEMAKKAKAHSAYMRAVELIAKLHGHLADKRDVRVIRSIQDLTDEELEVLAAESSRH